MRRPFPPAREAGFLRPLCLALSFLLALLPASSFAATVNVLYTTGAEIPVSAAGYTAAGNTVNVTLNYSPPPGTVLTVVHNTSLPFIQGSFANLAQGQLLTLTYEGQSYAFVANYYGGASGRDLVLQWANTALYAWGFDGVGALGSGFTVNASVPTRVEMNGTVLAGKTVVSGSIGGNHGLALCSDGTVAAWGYNGYGELGSSSTTTSFLPIQVPTAGTALEGKTVVAVAAGFNHSLALCSDGTVAAWGYNGEGQLGNNSMSNSFAPVAVATAGTALEGKTVVAIAAGANHNLALCSDGTLVSWGNNADGELGNGSTNSSAPEVVTTAGTPLAGKTVVAIAAADYHSLALCSDGSMAAWGDNGGGELGNGPTLLRSNVPVAVTTAVTPLAGKTVTAIAAGGMQSFALCSDGTAAGWGENTSGSLGDGSPSISYTPTSVSVAGTALAGKTVTRLAAGQSHTLALCSDGTVNAWGDNSVGELGDNSIVGSETAVAVVMAQDRLLTGAHFMQISAGDVLSLALAGVPPVPVIDVQQPAGASLVTGVSVTDFGSAIEGTAADAQTFLIGNQGAVIGDLEVTQVTVTGPNAADFVLTPTDPVATVPPQYGGIIVATFTPTVIGIETATLTFTSNDPLIPSFTVALIGIGVPGIDVTYTTGAEIPLSTDQLHPAGGKVSFTLNYAPPPGAVLTVVRTTSPSFIQGSFDNLAQGQLVVLSFGGQLYRFVANYYGGASGRDLVLQWADTELVAWGNNQNGELGNGSTTESATPIAVATEGTVLAGKTIFSIAAGYAHSLSICSDGTLAAWGENDFGQLGDASVIDSPLPIAVATAGTVLAGKTVVAVAAGYSHSLALCSDGTLAAWGFNGDGELGDGTMSNSDVPIAVATLGTALEGKTVIAIAAGYYHSLALCSDGTMAAWGYNIDGEVGNGSYQSIALPVAVTTVGTSLTGKTVTIIAAGDYHSLALCADGTLAAWGYDSGSGTTAGTILQGKTITGLAVGHGHNLALCSDGTVAAWGENNSGQLGDNSTNNSVTPVVVATTGTALAGKSVTAIGAGESNSLALCSDGSLAAWGYNGDGELGNGTTVNSFTPSAVTVAGTPLAGAATTRIASGDSFALALAATPLPASVALTAVYTTGQEIPIDANGLDATGNSISFTLNYAPAQGTVLTVAKNSALSFIQGNFTNLPQGQLVTLSYAGQSYNFVANYYGGSSGRDLVLQWADTALVAWGANDAADNYNEIAPPRVGSVPVALPTADTALTGKTVVAISTGPIHSIALCSDGTIAAWGDNTSGQLGDSAAEPYSAAPVAVVTEGTALAGKTIAAVVAGNGFSVALCADGTLATWGASPSGSSNAPVAVTTAGTALAGKSVAAVAAGTFHILALCTDGTLAAWGDNTYGQLGDNAAEASSNAPVAVATTGALAGKSVNGIAAGINFSVAFCSDGTLTVWGQNGGPDVAPGMFRSSVPEAIVTTGTPLAGETIAAVASGTDVLVLSADGSLAAFGGNFQGGVGDASYSPTSTPVAVVTAGTPLGGKTVTAVRAGLMFSLALCSDGSLAVWGDDIFGELGDGSTYGSYVPVAVPVAGTPLAGTRTMAISAALYHSLALTGATPTAAIEIEQFAGHPFTSDASVVAFGATTAGPSSKMAATLTIKSEGTATGVLDLNSVTIDGANAADFTVNLTGTETAIPSGEETTFTVYFSGSASGPETAALHVASNDPATPSFTINLTGIGVGATFNAAFAAATDIPLTADGVNVTGASVNFTLGFAPSPGTTLTVVKNNSPAFIQGTFSNLEQGQFVPLNYGGEIYSFIANYYGGSGRDLVLQWAPLHPFAWGYNGEGQLGDLSEKGSLIPVSVKTAGTSLAGKNLIALAAGESHSLALCSDGSVNSWGYNRDGELGVPESPIIATRVTTAGTPLAGKTVVAIAAGGYHSLALCSDGTLAAWGDNKSGELGNNSHANSSVPVAVATVGTALAGKSVTTIAAASALNVALCSDGSLVTWGQSSGALDGAFINSAVPIAVPIAGSALDGKTVMAIAVGGPQALALCTDGTLAAWGSNSNGELGNNSFVDSPLPVAVTTAGTPLEGRTVVAIAAGAAHNLALCADGTLVSWGLNATGQLGVNSTADSLVPIAVTTAGTPLEGKTIISIFAGNDRSVAICSDGTIAAWGGNPDGELGDNSTTNSLLPIAVSAAGSPLAGSAGVAVALGGDHTVALAAAPLPAGASTDFVLNGASLVIDALDAFAADQYSPKMTMVSQPSNGRVEIAHDRSAVTYVPGIRYGITGIDAFTYTITDSAGHAYTEQVTVRTPFYPAVGSYDGLVSYSTGANAGNPDGYLTLSLLGSGRFTGKLKLAGFSYVFAGAFSSGGAAKISIARPGQPPIRLTLTADLTAGDNIAASITAGGVVYTANTGARDPYSFTGNPTPSAGTYTVMLPAPSVVNGTTATATATVSHGSVTQITVTNGGSGYVAPPGVVIKGGAGLGAAAAAVVDAGSVTAVTVTERGSHYSASSLTVTIDPPSAGLPQGTGWATMTVSRGGAVTAAGKLGDGTAFSVGAFVHPGANETFAFYAPLAPGSVIGTVTFEDLAGSDCDSTLAWVKTAHPGGAFYPGGFTTSVSFVGARYAANPDAQVLEFTNATSGTALFNLTLDDQNIVSRDLLVSSKNAVTVSNPGPDELRLMINPATGTFTGTFLAGPARAPGTTAVSGVIYQKTNIGAGLFLDNGRAGAATLTPQ